MNPSRTIATLAIAASALAATAGGASALSGYEDGFTSSVSGVVLDVGVNYIGARSLRVQAVVHDVPGDAYCTIVLASVLDRGGSQIGAVQTLGSVCSGRTAALPLKAISTTSTDIDSVTVWATWGNTGSPTGAYGRCYRAADSHWGTPDTCR